MSYLTDKNTPYNTEKKKIFLKRTINFEKLKAFTVFSMNENFSIIVKNIKEIIADIFTQNKARKINFLFK